MPEKKTILINASLLTIGLILSPLTWWNDLLVNLPLAYLFTLPFTLVNQSLFLPSFILGYWATNLIGLLMIHWGTQGLIHKKKISPGIRQSLLVSFLYSVIIAIMVLSGWLESPLIYLEKFIQGP